MVGEPVAGLRFETAVADGWRGGATSEGGSPWPGDERTLDAPSWPLPDVTDEGTNGRGAELRLGASLASSLPGVRPSRSDPAERKL